MVTLARYQVYSFVFFHRAKIFEFMACSSESSGKLPSDVSTAAMIAPSPATEEPTMTPVLFEIFGEIWNVQARLGQGVSASVYRVSSGRSSTAAVKEFQADAQGGDYGYHKERSVLEDIQGHKNIGTVWLL